MMYFILNIHGERSYFEVLTFFQHFLNEKFKHEINFKTYYILFYFQLIKNKM